MFRLSPEERTIGEKRRFWYERMTVKCPTCGIENPESMKYCGNCGNQLSLSNTASMINSFNRAVYVLASLVLPSLGILIGLYYLVKPQRKNDYLGVLCIFLSVVNLAIVLYITSL